MVRYAVLGSGSSANAYIFQTEGFSFVIDNGFSARELIRRARAGGFDPALIRYILLTHTHSDHLKGVEVLARQLGIPVVRHHSLDLLPFLKGPLPGQIPAVPGETLRLGPLKLFPFETSHDALHSLSYAFDLLGRRFCVITDTGVVTSRMASCAVHSDVLFLESNYCPGMLERGPYPVFLQRRIASDQGHLSNQAAVDFLNQLGQSGRLRLKRVYLCHLSGTNNHPEVVQEHLDRYLTWTGRVDICPKGLMSPPEIL